MIRTAMFSFAGYCLIMLGIYAGKIDGNQYPRTVEVKKGRDLFLSIVYLVGAVALIAAAMLNKEA